MAVVDLTKKTIDFNPATEAEEVMQNVRTILSTPKFSVPLDRAFGISGDIIDQPINPDKLASLQSEIVTAVQTYEPRAEVLSVAMAGSVDGVLKPVIEINIKGGETS